MLSYREQERPSRRLFKTENRLYSFLTRSRSRSRSKNDELQLDTDNPPMPDPLKPTTNRNQPSSKPASRIPSRPISSTTTATNTTITPATPKARKRTTQEKPATTSPLTNSHSSSRPTTPKSSATRQKFNDLLDLALGRKSSRSRSRSRPNSPQPSLDVPPLPTHDDDVTPKPRKSFSPGRPSTPSSPSPTPKVLRVMNPTTSNTSTPTATSIMLPKFFAARNPPSDIRHQSTSPPVLPPIPSIVSAPIKRVSSLHRRSVRESPDTDTPDLQRKQSTDSTNPPKITHTPPTPLKGTPSGSSSEGNHTPSSSRSGYHTVKGSLDSGYRHRKTPMTILDEEGRLDIPKFTAPESILNPPVPRTGLKMSSATRATKHGSFDFERPGWSSVAMQRTGSNGTTTTTASAWSRNEGGLGKDRESTYGPGLAGVGTLQREVSVKRAEEREEALRARERAKKHHMDVAAPDKERMKGKTKLLPLTPSQRTTPSDQVHASTSTAGTGKSSSMSKGTGRRALKTASGSGISRLAGLTAHGLFSFESPVPSPTRSSGSTGTVHEVHIPQEKSEKEKERLLLEKERQKDRKSLQHRGDRPPVPVPKPSTNAGHRSGTKGRSLDLGLGLAWAPSKVREDALLPSSTFFTRSMNNSISSVGGRSVSGSTTGRSGSSGGHHSGSGDGTREPGVDRSKLGKEVAEVFRNALDAEGYATFKSYVHQFDAHKIPFDGPTGIVPCVRRLLDSAPGLDEEAKKQLLENFIRIILQQA